MSEQSPKDRAIAITAIAGLIAVCAGISTTYGFGYGLIAVGGFLLLISLCAA